MTKRLKIVALFTVRAHFTFAAFAAFARPAHAQPNLPPPPPPPIDQPSELPSLPPPPARGTPPSETLPPRASPPRRTPPLPAPYGPTARSHRTDDVVYVEPPDTHPVAVTLSPLGLFRGRLSASLEVQIARHHSLTLSPNLLVFHADRGAADSLVSEGLGFATATSSSVGIEFGYHYWWRGSRELRGPFLGPSLLLGSTTQASVGDPTRAQSYWGLAFDVGWQEVLPGGLTAGAGVGLETVRMSGAGAVIPRLLLQLGWSF